MTVSEGSQATKGRGQQENTGQDKKELDKTGPNRIGPYRVRVRTAGRVSLRPSQQRKKSWECHKARHSCELTPKKDSTK